MAREGYQVAAAIDGSTSALVKASKWHCREGLPFQGVAGDVTQLPFKSASFDAVIDVMCITHNEFHSQCYIMDEVARVLKPKGQLFSVMAGEKSTPGVFGSPFVRLMDESRIRVILGSRYTQIVVLPSTYYLSPDKFVENLVITATRTGDK